MAEVKDYKRRIETGVRAGRVSKRILLSINYRQLSRTVAT